MSDKPKKKNGRPVKTEVPEWGPRVIEWLYQGRSILEFCRQDGAPSRMTIYRWTERDPEFLQEFVRARTARAEALLDQAIEIATKTDGDWVVDKNGARKLDLEAVQQRKLASETLIKVSSCYQNGQGVSLRVMHSGDPNGAPIKIESKHDGPPVPVVQDLAKEICAMAEMAKELLNKSD